jgi:DNA-binding CsgD family transcriptional regulator
MTLARAIGGGLLWPRQSQGPSAFNDESSTLIRKIGSSGFYRALADILAQIGGVEHLHVFSVDDARPTPIASASHDGGRLAEDQFERYLQRNLWQHDVTMQELESVNESGPILMWTQAASVPSRELRDHWQQERFAERLLLFGREGALGIAMTAVRVGHDRPFTVEQIDRLAVASEVLLPMISRNVTLCRQKENVLAALTSLSTIESVLSSGPVHFPPRELQTCARFIYGLSAASIAAALSIGVETVASFRKRIYERLSIGCHREMLMWYLQVYQDAEFDVGLVNDDLANQDRVSFATNPAALATHEAEHQRLRGLRKSCSAR